VLILNRPGRRNAIDLELRAVLAEAIEGAMADDAIRALVLTGAGGTFCSGGDISTMKRQGEEAVRARLQAAQRVIRAIWYGPKPVLGAARQLLMMPRRLTAQEAVELGLADAVAEPGQALRGALADAEAIAAGPPLALAGIKAMLALWPADPRKTLEREVDLAVALMDAEDFAEGIAAFGEHRQPVFRGR
jgi:2-(1,2-epoxy-1,2-dihydrophenyl)acetyl-CoA isomerase